MHVGLDIGTTHISASVVDIQKCKVIDTPSYLQKRVISQTRGAYEEDVETIENHVLAILSSIKEPIESITVTGQVHGILYYDKDFKAISPLATWLDNRSLIKVDGDTIETLFYKETGISLPPGYGLLTHYANERLNLVPESAVGFCGILEYITGRLIGKEITKSDPSCLGTYGAFDPITKKFNKSVLDTVLHHDMRAPFEASNPFEIAGYTKEGVAVTYPVGDNQAGFFGMIDSVTSTALVSIGTSGQLSFFSTSTNCDPNMELREFLGLGYLHVGATLSAGKGYETLKNFFKDIYLQITKKEIDDNQLFDIMKASVLKKNGDEDIICEPLFIGTRKNPQIRASFTQIDLDNFTMGNIVESVVDGIVRELSLFMPHASEAKATISRIVATGSGVKKNYLFPRSIEKVFSISPTVAQVDDGAAIGAALVGAIATKMCSMEEKDFIVRTLISG